MKRRSFFKSFAAVIAAVALAPELAFNLKLSNRWSASKFGIYNQLGMVSHMSERLNMNDFIAALYAIKKERAEQKHIEIIIHEDSVPLLQSLL